MTAALHALHERAGFRRPTGKDVKAAVDTEFLKRGRGRPHLALARIEVVACLELGWR